MSELSCSTFTESKPGATPEQNEDRRSVRRHGAALIAAVSDGASAALFSGEWAGRLIGSIVAEWFDSDDELLRHVRMLSRDFDPLDGAQQRDFVLEDKWAERGSAATLAAVLVEDRNARVLAIGDSIVGLHTSSGADFFPLDAPADFGRHPELISTHSGDSLHVQRTAFTMSPGDVITLSTDAVGARFVAGRPTAADVKHLVEHLERGSLLRDLLDGPECEWGALGDTALDDDLTLVVIEAAVDGRDGRTSSWLARARRWLTPERDT